jgi:ubiquinone/menaquinone biosynthesis C-methylase UbiE
MTGSHSGLPSATSAHSTSTPIDALLDDNDGDSAIGTIGHESSTASLSESIFQYRRLHGRTYQSTDTTEYWAPNDTQQNEGLDLIHHALLKLFDDKLYLAPIGENPHRVLDLGTGTGIWAMDFGDQFPETEIIGTDISPIQPSWVAPNVKFVVDDLMLNWTWPADHFDFIHMRALYGVVPDLPALYAKAFRHVKPGGWVQQLEMDVLIKSDHVNFPEDHIFNRYAKLIYEAGERTGRSFAFAQDHIMKDHLEAAGFVDIVEEKRKLPLHSWPKDPKLRDVGTYLQTAFDESLEGLGTFLFTQVLGMQPEEVTVISAQMRKEAQRKSNLHYFDW